MDYKYVMEMLEKARSEGDTDKVQELESILSTMEPLDSDDNEIADTVVEEGAKEDVAPSLLSKITRRKRTLNKNIIILIK